MRFISVDAVRIGRQAMGFQYQRVMCRHKAGLDRYIIDYVYRRVYTWVERTRWSKEEFKESVIGEGDPYRQIHAPWPAKRTKCTEGWE